MSSGVLHDDILSFDLSDTNAVASNVPAHLQLQHSQQQPQQQPLFASDYTFDMNLDNSLSSDPNSTFAPLSTTTTTTATPLPPPPSIDTNATTTTGTSLSLRVDPLSLRVSTPRSRPIPPTPRMELNGQLEPISSHDGEAWTSIYAVVRAAEASDDVSSSFAAGQCTQYLPRAGNMFEHLIFGIVPLADDIDVVRCLHCHKAVKRQALAVHVNKHHTSSMSSELKRNLKRVISHDGRSAPRKRKSASSPPVERQQETEKKRRIQMRDIDHICGVMLSSGLLCAEPITCSVHSLNARQKVRGRSRTFGTLLARAKSALKCDSSKNNHALDGAWCQYSQRPLALMYCNSDDSWMYSAHVQQQKHAMMCVWTSRQSLPPSMHPRDAIAMQNKQAEYRLKQRTFSAFSSPSMLPPSPVTGDTKTSTGRRGSVLASSPSSRSATPNRSAKKENSSAASSTKTKRRASTTGSSRAKRTTTKPRKKANTRKKATSKRSKTTKAGKGKASKLPTPVPTVTALPASATSTATAIPANPAASSHVSASVAAFPVSSYTASSSSSPPGVIPPGVAASQPHDIPQARYAAHQQKLQQQQQLQQHQPQRYAQQAVQAQAQAQQRTQQQQHRAPHPQQGYQYSNSANIPRGAPHQYYQQGQPQAPGGVYPQQRR
jgi:SCA7, zinc-binding domain